MGFWSYCRKQGQRPKTLRGLFSMWDPLVFIPPPLLSHLKLTFLYFYCRTSMTEEYRVPDGMVGLSECGSLCQEHPLSLHLGDRVLGALASPEAFGLSSPVLLSPVISGWGRWWSSRYGYLHPIPTPDQRGQNPHTQSSQCRLHPPVSAFLLSSPPSHWQRRRTD